jgi:hypothetical protein
MYGKMKKGWLRTKIFGTLEINKNSDIGRAEAAGNKTFAAGFAEVDTDEHDFLSKENSPW